MGKNRPARPGVKVASGLYRNQTGLKGLAAQDFKKKGKRAKEQVGLRKVEAHGV